MNEAIKSSTPIALAVLSCTIAISAMCLKLSDTQFGSAMTLASVLAGAGGGIATQGRSSKVEAEKVETIEQG